MPNQKSKSKSKAVQTAGQTTFGLISTIGSSLLFLEPSKAYAAHSEVGKFISSYINPAWPIFFVSGAADFSAFNFYLAFESIPTFIEYIKQQATVGAKIGKGSLVILIAATQNLTPVLVTYGAGGNVIEMSCGYTGTLPAALYSTIQLLRYDLPKLAHLGKKLWYACHADSEEKQHFVLQDKLYKRLLNRLYAGWLKNLASPNNFLHSPGSSLIGQWHNLTYSLEQQRDYPEAWYEAVIKYGSGAIGFVLAAELVATIGLNSINILSLFMPRPLAIILGGYVTLSNAYLMPRMLGSAFYYFGAALINSASNKPIDWLAYQLYPKTTLISTLAAAIISLLSYTTVLSIFLKNYHGLAKEDLSYTAIAAIVLFHAIAFVKLLGVGVRRYGARYGNDAAKELIALEAAYIKATQLLPEEVFANKLVTNRTSPPSDSCQSVLGLNQDQLHAHSNAGLFHPTPSKVQPESSWSLKNWAPVWANRRRGYESISDNVVTSEIAATPSAPSQRWRCVIL